MRNHLCAVAAVCLLAAIATAAGASYVTELLFLGEGWYDHDAGTRGLMSYGDFGSMATDFNLTVRTAEEACHWYLQPDVTITFTDNTPGLGATHVLAVDQAGIWADQQLVEWSDVGYSWEHSHGVHLGYHDPARTPEFDPMSIIGEYAWDLDGGGDDLTAGILPSSTPDYAYRVTMEQRRSLTWLSTMPLGTLATGWMEPFAGGLPLDGLAFGLNKIAPILEEWEGRSYTVDYRGSIRLVGDAACPVPEPSTLLLLGSGLIAFGTVGFRRRHRN